jgi:hypothetical protein
LEAKAEGRGSVLLGLDALTFAPRNIALTLSNRLWGVLISLALGSLSAVKLVVGRLFVVADRGIPLAFEGDLISEPCPGVLTLVALDKDDLVGVIREARVDFDRGIPNPADLGAGIELPSRETGRLLDASSSIFCRARLAVARGSSTAFAGVDFVAPEAGVSGLKFGASSSSRFALD